MAMIDKSMSLVKQDHALRANDWKKQKASFDFLLNRLMELEKEYSNDDWDGHGASKLSASSVRVAKSCLSNFATTEKVPFVTIDTRGEVCFEYGDIQSSFVSVKFCDANKVLFVRSSPDAKTFAGMEITYDMLEGRKWLMMLPDKK